MDKQQPNVVGVEAANYSEVEGQILHPTLSFSFVETDTIESGSHILPIRLPSCPSAKEFGDLHLIKDDLEFALQCFVEAVKLGIPDPSNVVARALIFSGVTAYARSFVTGYRFKLAPVVFEGVWDEKQAELHDFLIALRNKHISHSVNEFERSDAVGILVADSSWNRKATVSGVGVSTLTVVGLSAGKLQQCLALLPPMVDVINNRINALRVTLHSEMKVQLASAGGRWEMAPIARFPNEERVAEKRGT